MVRTDHGAERFRIPAPDELGHLGYPSAVSVKVGLERGFAKVRSGGYVYLDNWDTKEFWGPAADFPTRPIKLYTLTTAGGALDILARLIADEGRLMVLRALLDAVVLADA